MQDLKKDVDFQKRMVWLNGALPGLWLAYDYATGGLGANPPEAAVRTTGVLSIAFLALTLAITPVAKWTNQPWLVRHRRWMGLWSFFYGSAHFFLYATFDKGLRAAEIVADVGKRPFILLGFLALGIMVPLAVTSTNRMIQRLGGKRWKRLHKLTYAVAPIAAFHYGLVVKSDYFYPGLFMAAFAALLSARLRWSLARAAGAG